MNRPTRSFSMSVPAFQESGLNDVIQKLVDKINELETQLKATASDASRLVSDRQPFRVQSVDKGTFRLEVDTPDGVKTVSLTNLE